MIHCVIEQIKLKGASGHPLKAGLPSQLIASLSRQVLRISKDGDSTVFGERPVSVPNHPL